MTTTQLVDGPTGKALSLDGVNDYLQSATVNLSAMASAYTIEAVAKFSENTAYSILAIVGTTQNGSPTLYAASTAGYLNTGVWGDNMDSTVTTSSSVFKTYGARFSGGSVVSVGNGALDTVSNSVTLRDQTTSTIALGLALTDYAGNVIRSVRISQTARSAAWLAASYNSDFDQLAIFEFFSFILNNPYPTSYIKTYGLQQQLQLTATFSGMQAALYYDTTFYTTSGIALTTITGTLGGSAVTTLLPTTSGVDYFWYATISVPSLLFSYTTPTYSFYNRYLCSGICNYINSPASGIVVNLHRRQTGQLIATTTTAGTGTFILDSIYSDMHYIVALHPDDSKNALIYDKIIPIN